MTLYIFNPEHDLCLANGGPHFMPPASASQMAARHVSVMRYLYGDDVVAVAAADVATVLRDLSEPLTAVVPWGWNLRLRQQLIDSGVAETLLPDKETLATLRAVQHRGSWLSLQPDTCLVDNPDAVDSMLRTTPHAVLKAPWSGAGRGLRWVSGQLTAQDRLWMARVVSRQRGVVVEPRRHIALEVALEYMIDRRLHFKGLSLFEVRGGVYRGNWLLTDDEIALRVAAVSSDLPSVRRRVERWLRTRVVGHYSGPVGVDLQVDESGAIHVGELNFRHTMGMVAHALTLRHPSWRGMFCSPLQLNEVVLSLGSNMGNRYAMLRRAIRKLSTRVGPVVQQSSVIETEPWGFSAPRKFLNQVVALHTIADPETVLRQILDVEAEMGRQRDYDPLHPPAEHRYQSRPVDIDILLFNNDVVTTPLLQIPHPRMHLRRFVLEPLCQLCPERRHPLLHRTFGELLETL